MSDVNADKSGPEGVGSEHRSGGDSGNGSGSGSGNTSGNASDRLVRPLWQPGAEQVAASYMEHFRLYVQRLAGVQLDDYDALHDYSVKQPQQFWGLLADFLEIPFGSRGQQVRSHHPMPHTRWFEGSTVNYAQAALYPKGLLSDDAVAIVGVVEGGQEVRLTWRQLRVLVARVQRSLKAAGVVQGDAVAAFSANVPETVAVFLACAGLGVVFSSCSPDFGWQAAAARFAQLKPKLLFATTEYDYGGKRFSTQETVMSLAGELPSLTVVVQLPYPQAQDARSGNSPGVKVVPWNEWLGVEGIADASTPGSDFQDVPEFLQLPFDQPLYVLYSSGTTGTPKAITHRAGGTLLTHMKEHRLHCNIGPGDVVYYFSTCGWMMWNWLVSALTQAATIVLYDGSPAWPKPLSQFDLAQRLGVTFFGTSARFISELRAQGLKPAESHDLSNIRSIASTGSPLSPDGFAYVYENIKQNVHLASVSGGTDIVSCFMLGVPTLPVYAGQIQRPGLGVDLRVLDEDSNDVVGQPGELVCAQPLPCMPLKFLNDHDFVRYKDAYLNDYPGMWRHGDLIERTAQGGVVVYGRSDATLNPGGVRIGTAEIYRPLESVPEVLEAVAVGKRVEADQQVWLLVVLKGNAHLTEELRSRIALAIRKAASPRHVPARILQVPQLPRTRSGKAMELAVARLVNGQSVPNIEVMANPESVAMLEKLLSDLE